MKKNPDKNLSGTGRNFPAEMKIVLLFSLMLILGWACPVKGELVTGSFPDENMRSGRAFSESSVAVDYPAGQTQQRSVTGKVTLSNGEPIPGATVVVKGTTLVLPQTLTEISFWQFHPMRKRWFFLSWG